MGEQSHLVMRWKLRRGALRVMVPAAVMLSSACSVQAQQYSWESSSGSEDSTGVVSVTSYSPGKMKYVSGNPADPELIIRLDRRSILVVNTRRGSYTEVSFADWKNMRGQQSAWVVQIPPDIEQLPPDERERRLHEYVAGATGGGAKPDVVRIPETKIIQGFPCAKWIVKLDNRNVLTVWATRAIKEFESMRGDLAESYRQLSLNYPAMRYLADALRSIDGFPVRFQAGETLTTVKTIQRRNWGDDEFEAPPGYRKTAAAIPGR